ncbi:MAG TPA: gamma-glutamyltransferase [Thermomicrobiaceae bacterium]|nr:gamma-glutamyltransferase [Thermomicrobiaceae bacterium]
MAEPQTNGAGAPVVDQGPKALATGRRAMVSTSHPAVTEAALAVLRDGGNAVDAMLTAIPLQHVVEPQMSTLAGGFGMLYWEAASGTTTYLNADLDHPAGGPIPRRGTPEPSGQRIAVPGTVVGMQAAAERFGTRPWASYFAPAIAAAEDGFPMYSFLYGELAGAWERVTHYPSGRERYAPAGYLPPVGSTYRQPAHAAALRRIARDDGVEWFQRGEFARHFVDAVVATGGTMTLEDLAGYAVRWDEPLRFRAFGHDLVGAAMPDYGPFFVDFMLGVLERAGVSPREPWLGSSRAMLLVGRALAAAEDHVARYARDPAAFDLPVETLLSPQYLELQARLLTGSFPTADLTPAKPDLSAAPAPADGGVGKTDSNHLVIVDEAGNWLTMLHTVYGTPFGTGLVVDGISVNSGNGFPGVSVGPGRRIVTPLTPMLAMRDGRPWLGIGTPGSACQTIALVLLNLLGYGMTLEEAIVAPRFRLEAGEVGQYAWTTGRLLTETRIPEETVRGIVALGVPVAPLGDFNWHLGSVQAVMRDGEQLIGATDPRRCGLAAGY